jgi:hypothetical protein
MKTETEVIFCPYCTSGDTKFNGSGAYVDHKNHAVDVFFEYECEDCGKKFYLDD